jgi:nitrous oxide reductase accessory protein NosL
MVPAASKSPLPRLTFTAFLVLTLSVSCSSRRGGPVPASAGQGYCPVCKMNVKANDKWATTIFYRDGTKLMFETPGDMLMFYTSPAGYEVPASHKDLTYVEKIEVKDYLSGNAVDIDQATLVYKSGVKSPMGPDLIPFALKKDALLFVKEHGGTLMSFVEVTPDIVRYLRKG